MLDRTEEPWLSDWLLRARPENLGEIAAGVAVHALLRCEPEIWDALMDLHIANHALAAEWYDAVEHEFIWSPPKGGLFP